MGLRGVSEDMKLLATLCGLLIAAMAVACLWDSDSLSHEARGKLSLIDAVTGRIERYPPVYYEKRIELAKKALKTKKDFSLYDDIAVAYDRLGQHKQSIAYMALKRKEMAARPNEVDSTVRYRTEANEGTFWAHKWYAEGRRVETKRELIKGRDMIAKAIQINPDAHFGREHVQLMMMDWSLEPEKKPLWRYLDEKKELNEKTKEGLVGLMVLGNAWENPEVLGALGSVKAQDNAVNQLILFRIKEVQKETKLDDRLFKRPPQTADEHNIRENFDRLRGNANEFQANLASFVERRVQSGMHPDKDGKRFWEGYEPVGRIEFVDPPFSVGWWLYRNPGATIAIAVALLVIFSIVAFWLFRRIRRWVNEGIRSA